MTIGTRRISLLVATGVLMLLVGAGVWGVALFAVGRATEDICFGDLDKQGYGGYEMQGELFPPRLDCVLGGPDDDTDPDTVTAAHPLMATAYLVAVIGVPMVWLVGTSAVLWTLRRRPYPADPPPMDQ